MERGAYSKIALEDLCRVKCRWELLVIRRKNIAGFFASEYPVPSDSYPFIDSLHRRHSEQLADENEREE
jgi:hypothetical protein